MLYWHLRCTAWSCLQVLEADECRHNLGPCCWLPQAGSYHCAGLTAALESHLQTDPDRFRADGSRLLKMRPLCMIKHGISEGTAKLVSFVYSTQTKTNRQMRYYLHLDYLTYLLAMYPTRNSRPDPGFQTILHLFVIKKEVNGHLAKNRCVLSLYWSCTVHICTRSGQVSTSVVQFISSIEWALPSPCNLPVPWTTTPPPAKISALSSVGAIAWKYSNCATLHLWFFALWHVSPLHEGNSLWQLSPFEFVPKHL